MRWPHADRQQLLAMSGVYAVLFLLGLETTIGGSILPQATLALDGFELFAWSGTLQMLASACTTLLAARLGDIHGRKRLLQLAIVLLCLAGIGAALANSMLQLLAMRILNGIALGMLAATAFALPADVFPLPAERVRWQSLGGVMFALASSLGPLLGAGLSAAFGWRAALFAVPLASLGVLWILRWLPSHGPGSRPAQQFDWVGGLLLCAFILSSLLALQLPLTFRQGLLWAGFCVLSLVLLWRWLCRVREPILSLAILCNRQALLIVCSTLLSGAVLFILLFYGPLLLTRVAGLNLAQAGATLIPLLVGMPLGSLLNGVYFPRSQAPQRLLALGALLLTLGCALLGWLTPLGAPLLLLPGFALCGIGLGFINQNQTLFMQMITPVQHLGAATGLVSMARTYGGALGSAALGILLHRQALEQALLQGVAACCLVAALIIPLSLRVRVLGLPHG